MHIRADIQVFVLILFYYLLEDRMCETQVVGKNICRFIVFDIKFV